MNSTEDTGPHNRELDTVIAEVKNDFRILIGKKKSLILKLGGAFEKVVAKAESICEEIKTALKDEITEGEISARNIERYCPDEWKHKTKPKNAKLLFNKSLDHAKPIAIDNDGRTISEPPLNTEKQVTMKNFSEDEDYLDDTTNHIKFEFSIEYDKLQHYMANEFKIHQGSEPAWISGTMDRQTLKMTSVKLGRQI